MVSNIIIINKDAIAYKIITIYAYQRNQYFPFTELLFHVLTTQMHMRNSISLGLISEYTDELNGSMV